MKARFSSLSMREQALLVVFAVLVGVVWLTSAAARLRGEWRDWRTARSDVEAQQFWLDRSADIARRNAEAAKSLDPARTFDSTRLVSEVSAMAREAGLTISTESPRTTKTANFTINVVQATARRATLAAAIKFYEELGKRAPYLGLEECTLQAERGGNGSLSVTLRVASVEVVAARAAK